MKTYPEGTIRIDGSQGEGGGQVLRSALTLSMITGRPFSIEKIRAKRKKPGLMRQHLTAVKAAAQVACARGEGAELSSSALTFVPGHLNAGHYQFSVGTAGSTMLILQTILLPLCLADGPSEIDLEGGTHNPYAPPFDFLERVFRPILQKMGARARLVIERPGFYPAGGGRVKVAIEPCERLSPIDLTERGGPKARRAIAILSNLPPNIGDRELKIARDRLDFERKELTKRESDGGAGPGNVFLVELEFEHITEIFTGFGERGRPAEGVARGACDEAERYLKTDAPVGDYLADQLLLPFALAGGGCFRCLALTQHFRTNVEIIQKFLPVAIKTEREERLSWRVSVTQHTSLP